MWTGIWSILFSQSYPQHPAQCAALFISLNECMEAGERLSSRVSPQGSLSLQPLPRTTRWRKPLITSHLLSSKALDLDSPGKWTYFFLEDIFQAVQLQQSSLKKYTFKILILNMIFNFDYDSDHKHPTKTLLCKTQT